MVFRLIAVCSFTSEIHTRALAQTFDDDGESGPLAAFYFILSYAQDSFGGDYNMQRAMGDRSTPSRAYFVCS